jgi:uncharacterized protein (TIGR02118 family)
MTVLTVCYESKTTMDHDYYQKTHMAMVEKLSSQGMRRAEARKILGTPIGDRAPFQMIASLYFDNPAALAAAMGSEQGRALAADIPNFFEGQPDFMIGEVA